MAGGPQPGSKNLFSSYFKVAIKDLFYSNARNFPGFTTYELWFLHFSLHAAECVHCQIYPVNGCVLVERSYQQSTKMTASSILS